MSNYTDIFVNNIAKIGRRIVDYECAVVAPTLQSYDFGMRRLAHNHYRLARSIFILYYPLGVPDETASAVNNFYIAVYASVIISRGHAVRTENDRSAVGHFA